jgi:hypothetical protein
MDMSKLDYYWRGISLSIEEALMRPDLEFSMNLKKARIKENDAAIERLNEEIANLEIKKEKETDLKAKVIMETELDMKIAMRISLVERNRIDAQIVLGLMK